MRLSNLERLTLFGNAANDLTPLLALKKLQMLDVCGVNANKSLLYYIPEFHP
jgi:Leucine-rich repeat (LRR) protein